MQNPRHLLENNIQYSNAPHALCTATNVDNTFSRSFLLTRTSPVTCHASCHLSSCRRRQFLQLLENCQFLSQKSLLSSHVSDSVNHTRQCQTFKACIIQQSLQRICDCTKYWLLTSDSRQLISRRRTFLCVLSYWKKLLIRFNSCVHGESASVRSPWLPSQTCSPWV